MSIEEIAAKKLGISLQTLIEIERLVAERKFKRSELPSRKLAMKRYQTRYYKARRKNFLRQGLTTAGLPRKRSWTHLTGFTDEQKHERRKKQQLSWAHSKRYPNGQKPKKIRCGSVCE